MKSIALIFLSFTSALAVVTQHKEFVGFTAWMQDTQVYNYGSPIIFDGVNVNSPNEPYQSSTGRFFCPYDGVYFISLNLRRTADSLHVRVVKVKDATVEVMNVRDTNSNNDFITVSNSAIVTCEQFEYIAVLGGSNGYEVYGKEGLQYSTFSIFMISEGLSNQHNGTTEGFSAGLSTSIVSMQFTQNQMLRFTNVFYNTPNYFPIQGHYQCPVTGIYYITTNFEKYNANSMKLGVVQDYLMIMHLEDSYSNNAYHTVSNSRLVRCAAGQELSVRGLEPGYIYDYYATSTFSAFLLHEEASHHNDAKHESFIGFSAFKQEYQSYSIEDIISFTGILFQEGVEFDGYRFVCPVDGFYYTALHVRKSSTSAIYLEVVEASVILLRIEATYTSNSGSTHSNSGIFRCVAGEEVKVQAFGGGTVWGDPLHFYSTFTVMLLQAL